MIGLATAKLRIFYKKVTKNLHKSKKLCNFAPLKDAWRFSVVAQHAALSRRKPGFESRIRY